MKHKQNRLALIGGASDGIGKAIAEVLAQAEIKVVLLGRNEEKLKAVIANLAHKDRFRHDYIVADYQFPAQVQQQVQAYMETNKIGFDILINNTGGPKGGPVHKAEANEFIAAFNMHLINNQLLAQTVLPFMKNNNWGRIINVISTSVKQPLDNLGVSNTIRAAVGNWAKTLATELASMGITVNNVLPGATATGRLTDIINNKALQTGKSIEAVSLEMQKEIPAQRFARPEEIAYAVEFLASDKAAYITGINLPVDGGRTKSL